MMMSRLNLTTLDNTLLSPQHPRLNFQSADVPPINQVWFQEKLRDLKLSQRQLAKKIDLDPAAVSLMFAGRRSMTMDEAKAIADILLVPVTEVMRQAGIEVLDDVRKVPIAGYIGSGAMVTLLPNGTHDMVIAPHDVPVGSFALQIRIVNDPRDGWINFVSGTQSTAAECMDKVCVVALKEGSLIHAVIKRGYKRDLYNLIVFLDGNQRVLENTEIAWAARVLWIQPT